MRRARVEMDNDSTHVVTTPSHMLDTQYLDYPEGAN